MSLIDHARQFWSAAYFLRQAGERDRTVAVKVLRHLARSSNKTIAAKAEQALTDHESKRSG